MPRPPADERRLDLTAAVFVRLLGASYAVAILSLWVQLDGLIGRDGVLPVASFLERLTRSLGRDAYWQAPTLAWLGASDAALHALCALGCGLAALAIAGLVPAAALAGLWAIYLSLTVAGQTFFSFQWDNLLLEAGVLGVLVAPPVWRLGGGRPTAPSRLALFLVRWLVFRLMLGSGLVKVASGDPSWWPDLTALTYHYETTPLPTWTGWYVHQAPVWVHQVTCALVLASELAVPFLILGPRRLRLAAFWVLIAQQAVIAATGNYAFFNLLTVVLCLALLDDDAWPARWRARRSARGVPRPTPRWWTGLVVAPVAALVLALGAMLTAVQVDRFLARFDAGLGITWPAPIARLGAAVAPFRSVNGYGLFAHMTKTRPEIVIEGSDDGEAWRAYAFRWKPGDPLRRPRFVAPHQPRLDWQMWFAALGSARGNPWLIALLRRLLEGSAPVVALLAENPFPERPPRYVRAVLYDYRFTDWEARQRDGAWWRREVRGLYAPVLARRERD